MKKDIFMPALLALLLLSGMAAAEGLNTLISVGKSQAKMASALEDETEIYEKVKRGIKRGDIQKGDDQNSIRRSYGEPVVIMPREGGGERWVYKPGYASHFDGIKIYLFFDENKKLDEIQVLTKKVTLDKKE